MPTRDELVRALRRADEAGDTDAARAIAQRLSAPAPEVPTPEAAAPEPEKTLDEKIVETAAKARTGLGASGIKGAFGLSDVARTAGGVMQRLPGAGPILGKTLSRIGAMSPQGQERANMLAAINEEVEKGGGVAKGFEIGGDIAQAAIPGAGLQRGATAVAGRVLPNVLARIGGAAGAGALESAALTPEEDKLKAAGYGAAGGGLGEAGTAAAGRVIGGLVKPSEAGQQLMEQGIQPSVAKGSKGIIGSILAIPGEIAGLFGKDITDPQVMNAAKKEITDVLAKHGVEDIPEAVGRGVFDEKMTKGFNKGYSSILKSKEIPLSESFIPDAKTMGIDKIRDEGNQKWFEKEMDKILPKGDKVSGDDWKSALSEIRTLERKYQRNYTKTDNLDSEDLAKAFDAVESHLTDTLKNSGKLTKKELADLDELDAGYKKLKTLHQAADYRQSAGGPVHTDELIKAVEARTPEAEKRGLKGQYQNLTEPMAAITKAGQEEGAKTVKRHLLYKALALAGGTAAAPVVGLPLLAASGVAGLAGMTKPGAKVLMGNTAIQQRMANALRRLSPYSQVGATAGKEYSENE